MYRPPDLFTMPLTEENDLIASLETVIPDLRRYARALLKDRAAADDLVQDCLVRAIESWHQRYRHGSVRAWTFAILHNLAMTRLRRSSRGPTQVPLEDAAEHHIAVEAPQEEALRRRDFLKAMDLMGEEHRTVLLLVGVEDLSYAEAAQVLGVPIGTVMSRLSRARARLAALMTDGVGGTGRPTVVAEGARSTSFLRRVK